jgi:hypothetical protein
VSQPYRPPRPVTEIAVRYISSIGCYVMLYDTLIVECGTGGIRKATARMRFERPTAQRGGAEDISQGSDPTAF